MDRQLAAFLTVARLGNLTLAAQQLNLTQPALTKRLVTLEERLNVSLFDRKPRGMELTAAGRIYLRHASRIEQEYRQASEEIGILENAGMETLRIGAGPLFHLRYVAQAFSAVRTSFPMLRLDLLARNNAETLPLLVAGELDLVLGTIEPLASEYLLHVIPLLEVEQAVALAKDMPCAAKEVLSPSDLMDMDWVSYSQVPGSRELLTRYFAQHQLGIPRFAAQTTSFTAGLHLIRHSNLAMQVPLQIQPVVNHSDVSVVPVSPPLGRSAAGIYLRESSQGIPAVQAMIEELRRITGATPIQT
ncbi:LysR family transcriptional regulator [Roseibium suaedae]|uniref:DNA-binding transcriptional regulator, LysR family n=1 Tax=Roseibium suaedae TaxID=735517 RepID=A0A1M7NM67_9HYPH|nr:LysR family transcriptional regulator [Roseibium suaedae]SHN04993.1 DNA-binding transcriptional regulator, LysR family [Roseibium suaedae]